MRNIMAALLKVGVIALMALALVAFVSACGGSSDGDGGSDGEVAEHVEGDEHADDEHADDEHADEVSDDHESGGTVHVALNEWSIEPAHGEAFEAAAGEVVFEIHNEGAAPHDFKIVKTDLAPDALTIADGMVDLEASGEVIGGSDPLPGDIEVEEAYHLESGDYVLVCTLPGHYQQGMFAELTIE